jgi:hypothetical protein
VRHCAYEEALSWLDLAAGAASNAAESSTVDRITARVLELIPTGAGRTGASDTRPELSEAH